MSDTPVKGFSDEAIALAGVLLRILASTDTEVAIAPTASPTEGDPPYYAHLNTLVGLTQDEAQLLYHARMQLLGHPGPWPTARRATAAPMGGATTDD